MGRDKVIQSTKEVLCVLEGYAINGLPDMYATFEGMLTNWHCKLPWIEREFICAFEFLISDSEATRITDLILEKFDYDLMTECRAECTK